MSLLCPISREQLRMHTEAHDTMVATIQSPRERELRGHDTGGLAPMSGKVTKSLFARFVAKVDLPDDLDQCWIWTGAKAGRPGEEYGRIWAGHRSPAGNPSPTPSHRVSYELFVGPIPEGLEIDHLCRVHLCVNPRHLEPVTYEENQRRGYSPMANQARQTHCKRGHEFTPENTYVWGPERRCRKCNTEAQRQRRAARRA